MHTQTFDTFGVLQSTSTDTPALQEGHCWEYYGYIHNCLSFQAQPTLMTVHRPRARAHVCTSEYSMHVHAHSSYFVQMFSALEGLGGTPATAGWGAGAAAAAAAVLAPRTAPWRGGPQPLHDIPLQARSRQHDTVAHLGDVQHPPNFVKPVAHDRKRGEVCNRKQCFRACPVWTG